MVGTLVGGHEASRGRFGQKGEGAAGDGSHLEAPRHRRELRCGARKSAALAPKNRRWISSPRLPGSAPVSNEEVVMIPRYRGEVP
ncbi:MAG: hypothetical protein M3R38_20130, partial [Actinomycetota bacterium]|nr:hypothetical protein [Actinomycetota bacterium]